MEDGRVKVIVLPSGDEILGSVPSPNLIQLSRAENPRP